MASWTDSGEGGVAAGGLGRRICRAIRKAWARSFLRMARLELSWRMGEWIWVEGRG